MIVRTDVSINIYTSINSYWSGLFKIIVCTRVIDVDQNMDQWRSMWINVDRCGSM